MSDEETSKKDREEILEEMLEDYDGHSIAEQSLNYTTETKSRGRLSSSVVPPEYRD